MPPLPLHPPFASSGQPSPPPQTTPGGVTLSQVQVVMQLTVQGTVEDFDQAGFQASLGAYLGVPPADIRLSVSAASVSVVATITFADASAASSVVDTLQGLASDLSALSAAVGVTVEGATGPVVSQVVIPAPSPPSQPPPRIADNGDTIMVSAAGGALVLLLAAAGGAVLYRRRVLRERTTTRHHPELREGSAKKALSLKVSLGRLTTRASSTPVKEPRAPVAPAIIHKTIQDQLDTKTELPPIAVKFDGLDGRVSPIATERMPTAASSSSTSDEATACVSTEPLPPPAAKGAAPLPSHMRQNRVWLPHGGGVVKGQATAESP